MRFHGSVRRDPAIERWMREHTSNLGAIAKLWFDVLRNCGDDVKEILHDNHPTVCVGDAAFAYVNALKHLIDTAYTDMKGRLEA